MDAEVARKQAEAARARWSELLAAGPELLFGPRRDDCPWCGATDLAPAAVVTDALQRRPGTFRFDRCGSCRHVFQNPALSPPVVQLYDEDRSTEPAADAARGWRAQPCPAGTVATRARLVRRHIVGSEPASWLDVGPGDGRLCTLARRDFPRTRFAGLGAGDDLDAAARHGWLDEAHTGRLPEIARDLAGRFDVVSMCGHLERSRDPGAELAAARHALRPGGHLLVEAIDPDCRAGALLGRWWGSWSPHHQHLMPFANLCGRLRDEGFTVVATERRPAHRSVEVATATRLLLGRLGPEVGRPWLPPASTTGRLRHTVVAAAGTPLVGLATLVDRVSGGIVGRLPAGANAYRVLARVGD